MKQAAHHAFIFPMFVFVAHTICEPVKIVRGKTRTVGVPLTRSEAHDHLKRTLRGSKWARIRGFPRSIGASGGWWCRCRGGWKQVGGQPQIRLSGHLADQIRVLDILEIRVEEFLCGVEMCGFDGPGCLDVRSREVLLPPSYNTMDIWISSSLSLVSCQGISNADVGESTRGNEDLPAVIEPNGNAPIDSADRHDRAHGAIIDAISSALLRHVDAESMASQ